MRTFAVVTLSVLLFGLQLSKAEPASVMSPVVAHVLGKHIAASDIGLEYDAQGNPNIPKDEASCLISDPISELQSKITAEVARDYVTSKHLKATDEEIRQLQVYQVNFAAKDQVKRQKELAQLDERLKTTALNPKEKEKAEHRRTTLLRLTKSDNIEARATVEELRSVYAPWIETWKFNKAVYEQYGGAVAITKLGPDPVEATNRLLEQYEKDGKLLILNTDLKSAFWSRLRKPPRFAAKPNEIDFTPSWKKPLPKNGD